jgi:hypothetical protein
MCRRTAAPLFARQSGRFAVNWQPKPSSRGSYPTSVLMPSRGRLRQKRITPLPSMSSIEREVRAAGMTRSRRTRKSRTRRSYPPPPPASLISWCRWTSFHGTSRVDRATRVFNAIDVVLAIPPDCSTPPSRATDAVHFLLHASARARVCRELHPGR